MGGSGRSTPPLRINGQYVSDDTLYTKIGILSRTKTGPSFGKSRTPANSDIVRLKIDLSLLPRG